MPPPSMWESLTALTTGWPSETQHTNNSNTAPLSPMQTSTLPSVSCPHCHIDLSLTQMQSHACVVRDLEYADALRPGRNSCRVSPLNVRTDSVSPSKSEKQQHQPDSAMSSPVVDDLVHVHAEQQQQRQRTHTISSVSTAGPARQSNLGPWPEKSGSTALGWMAALRQNNLADSDDDDEDTFGTGYGYHSDSEYSNDSDTAGNGALSRRQTRRNRRSSLTEAMPSAPPSPTHHPLPTSHSVPTANEWTHIPPPPPIPDETTTQSGFANVAGSRISNPPKFATGPKGRRRNGSSVSRDSTGTASSSGSFRKPVGGGPAGLRINTVIANAMAAAPSGMPQTAPHSHSQQSSVDTGLAPLSAVSTSTGSRSRSGTTVAPLSAIPVSPLTAISMNPPPVHAVSRPASSHRTIPSNSSSKSGSSKLGLSISTNTAALSPSSSVSSSGSGPTSRPGRAPPRPPRPGNGDVDDYLVQLRAEKSGSSPTNTHPPTGPISRPFMAPPPVPQAARSHTYPPVHGRARSRDVKTHRPTGSRSSIVSTISAASATIHAAFSGKRPQIHTIAVDDHLVSTSTVAGRGVVVDACSLERQRSCVAAVSFHATAPEQTVQTATTTLTVNSGSPPSPSPTLLSPSGLPSPSFRSEFLPKDSESDSENQDMLRPDQPIKPARQQTSQDSLHPPTASASRTPSPLRHSPSPPSPDLPTIAVPPSLPASLSIGRPGTASSTTRSITPTTPISQSAPSPVVSTFPVSPAAGDRSHYPPSPASSIAPAGWDMRPYGSSYMSSKPAPNRLGVPNSRPGTAASSRSNPTHPGDRPGTSHSTTDAGPPSSRPSTASSSVDPDMCMGCRQPLKPVDKSAPRKKIARSAEGRLPGRYHVDCLVCADCGCKFLGMGAVQSTGPAPSPCYIHNATPVCRVHYHTRNGSLCPVCQDGIEGGFVVTLLGRVHQGCASRAGPHPARPVAAGVPVPRARS